MESYGPWLASLSLLLIVLLLVLSTLTYLALRAMRTWQLRMARAQATTELRHRQSLQLLSTALSTTVKEHTKHLQLMSGLADKGMALAASADSLTFQAVQAMGTTPSAYDDAYDPSDKGEIERIRDRDPSLQGDDLSGFERAQLIAELGIDPEFFGDDQ
jgi:hypothetical protein